MVAFDFLLPDSWPCLMMSWVIDWTTLQKPAQTFFSNVNDLDVLWDNKVAVNCQKFSFVEAFIKGWLLLNCWM